MKRNIIYPLHPVVPPPTKLSPELIAVGSCLAPSASSLNLFDTLNQRSVRLLSGVTTKMPLVIDGIGIG